MKKCNYNFGVVILTGVLCLVIGVGIGSLSVYDTRNYNDMAIRMLALEAEMDNLEVRVDEIQSEENVVEENEKATETEVKEETSAVANQGETVWKTKSGKKYHKENCGSLSKSAIAVSLKEATAAGLEPCKRCFK